MIKKIILKIKIFILYLLRKIVGFNKIFVFQNNKYKYFYHLYNNTWDNERSLEISIIKNELKNYKGKNILEVGNVLSHYFPINHEVVDKYETGNRVINEDITTFSPSHKYDLIVSISTLEHVGLDDKVKNPEKFIKAIKNLRKIVNPSGKILITIPIGFNKFVDNLLINNKIKFDQKYFFQKISKNNDWKEISFDKIKLFKYNYPFLGANTIAVVIILDN